MNSSRKNSSKVGIIACWILALIFLTAAIWGTWQIQRLLNEGVRTHGIVTGIDRGVKGSKYAILTFRNISGAEITAADMFPMIFRQYAVNDQVSVIHHAKQNSSVTIDDGIWIWQFPAMFYLGFIILAILGIIIPRMERDQPHT